MFVPGQLVGAPVGPRVVHDLGAAHRDERGLGGDFYPVQDIKMDITVLVQIFQAVDRSIGGCDRGKGTSCPNAAPALDNNFSGGSAPLASGATGAPRAAGASGATGAALTTAGTLRATGAALSSARTASGAAPGAAIIVSGGREPMAGITARQC